MKTSLVAAVLASVLLASGGTAPAAAADNRVQCDFHKYEKAVAAAQAQGPALLGTLGEAMTPMPLNSVSVIDNAIRRKVMVENLFARRTPAGSVELTVRVVNCTDYPQQVLGRASFLDAAQIPTEKPSAWQVVFLEPHSAGIYREVSIGREDVASYRVELQGNR